MSDSPSRSKKKSSSWWKRLRRRRADRAFRISWKTRLMRIPKQIGSAVTTGVRGFFGFKAPEQSSYAPRGSKAVLQKLTPLQYLNPFRWIIWFVVFLYDFIRSRPYLSAGPGLPALAFLVCVGWIYARQQYHGAAERSGQYRRAFTAAYGAKDLDTALICVKTLIDLHPDNLDFKYQRALVEKELHHDDIALDMMGRLATQHRYGVAAVWLITSKLDVAKVPEWKPEDHEYFRMLMSIALSSMQGENLAAAKLLMAGYLSNVGATSDSLRYLTELTTANPSLAMTAAEQSLKIGRVSEAKNFAGRAQKYYEELLAIQPGNVDNRISLARSLVIQDKETTAVQVLQDGFAIAPDDRLRDAISEAMVLEASRLAKSNQPDAMLRRMQLIRQAVQSTPNNSLVIEALVQLTLQCRKNNDPEADLLRKAALQGLDPETIHFVRGTAALMDNRIDEARTHLELAAKSGLQLPGILNNLAVAISTTDGGDLQQALQLADEALKRLEHPYLFETRGQIYFKLKRYEEAVLDLERGLQAPELAKAICPNLAEAYDALGDKDLAEAFRARAAALAGVEPEKKNAEPAPAAKQ